ncbi:hypothetical protein DM860_009932 [Cuscuta australis]|uniref:Uncharacterized protein n=1 Tax=Cuscuta australis TaxID=267555 RepID=A0A328DD37_9ASTE|nr:hypothetical protein DM860_009932 [Cuscuta australis]
MGLMLCFMLAVAISGWLLGLLVMEMKEPPVVLLLCSSGSKLIAPTMVSTSFALPLMSNAMISRTPSKLQGSYCSRRQAIDCGVLPIKVIEWLPCHLWLTNKICFVWWCIPFSVCLFIGCCTFQVTQVLLCHFFRTVVNTLFFVKFIGP